MLRILSTPFWAQKAGNPPDEYEDAFHPERCGEYVGDRLAFAVADGATEGMLSGRWARLVTTLYKRQWRDMEQVGAWLDRAYRDWDRLKLDYTHKREAQHKPIQWYEEPGLAAGAFSTLLGITLQAGNPPVEPDAGPDDGNPEPSSDPVSEQETAIGRFTAVAAGDSCLFQVRGGELRLEFPLTHSDQFDNRPLLLASNPARNGRAGEHFKVTCGDLQPGDRFYLMTDALAAWFLREYESGNAPWRLIEDLGGNEAPPFAEWVAALRQDHRIRNDDVTCLRLQLV